MWGTRLDLGGEGEGTFDLRRLIQTVRLTKDMTLINECLIFTVWVFSLMIDLSMMTIVDRGQTDLNHEIINIETKGQQIYETDRWQVDRIRLDRKELMVFAIAKASLYRIFGVKLLPHISCQYCVDR